ncbi:uncharacterized protein FOMMEDRAFT_166651 [Fomitiporia mediterranea MF3/22]|uniref:uncharacterized protein n=1 Tax=Fomitiporia mediterranea (strain MF3/22) TaxID=694068 RepID=UPI0004408186|nr:uncharacterized protein FOMMEDRAFT_166651 [Fomitiporia mediterranea MF3/22]EJD04905.1 hypothetical protein FOMMEDRAFT_166651 [Fomitiporia mediterranea MF3/22]
MSNSAMDGSLNTTLESVTQRTLYSQNFSRSSSQASHALTDLLSRYVSLLATTCARYAEHAGRASVSVPDAMLALNELGVSVDELKDYVEGEGREMSVENYAFQTEERREWFVRLKGILNEGRRIEHDDAVALVYAEVPEMELNGHWSGGEDDAEASEDDEYDLRQKMNGDATMYEAEIDGIRMASPVLPLSPISNPSSPSRKRPRLASWNPPSHIPEYLPPLPLARNGDVDHLPSPHVKSELEADHSAFITGSGGSEEFQPLDTTSSSAADYLTPVQANSSNLASVPAAFLPERHNYKKALSGHSHALQLQPRKYPTPDKDPALYSAYHHLLTNPPSSYPSTNPARHRVALAMLYQAYSNPRWTAADTLFGSAAAPKPRVVAPGPSFPIPIGPKGKEDQPSFMPPSSWRSIAANECVAPPSYQPRSRIPDITRAILPFPVFTRATRLNPPPPLVNSSTKEKLLYGAGVPALWNSNSTNQQGSTNQPGKSKGNVDDGGEDRQHAHNEKDSNVLPDAMLLATWDWETHDFRQPPPHPKRVRALSSFNLNSISNAGSTGVDGVAQPGGPVRKNSIKIGKGK